MTTPHDSRPQEPTTTPRRRLLIVGLSAALAVLIVAAVVVLWPDDADTHQARPGSAPATDVAVLFLQRYAAGSPGACDLATDELRASLARDGRCSGPGSDESFTVEILFATTCGDRTGVGATMSAPGNLGTSFARVSLIQIGSEWRVRALLPIKDGTTMSSYPCASPQTEYGG